MQKITNKSEFDQLIEKVKKCIEWYGKRNFEDKVYNLVLDNGEKLKIVFTCGSIAHLLGIDTVMIRTTDCSIYTSGETIAAKKVSDLKERVRIANNTENAIPLSIHQNHFTNSQYSGAQVFYAPTDGSNLLAQQMQTAFITALNPGSNRKIKKADGVYLMQNISCPGILVECGFLSNPQEEALLLTESYRQRVAEAIAQGVLEWAALKTHPAPLEKREDLKEN